VGEPTVNEACALCGEEWTFFEREARVCFQCRLRPHHLSAIAERLDSDLLRRKAAYHAAEVVRVKPDRDAMDERLDAWRTSGDDPTLNPVPAKLPPAAGRHPAKPLRRRTRA
jgi:hypothetical protein